MTEKFDRAKQFRDFRNLLVTCSQLDRGSNFLAHAQECIDIAKSLDASASDFSEESFADYVRDLIINDRIAKGEIKK